MISSAISAEALEYKMAHAIDEYPRFTFVRKFNINCIPNACTYCYTYTEFLSCTHTLSLIIDAYVSSLYTLKGLKRSSTSQAATDLCKQSQI